MRIRSVIISVFLLITLSACERTPDISSSKQYDQNGVSFSYPGNWKVTNEINNGNTHFVSIQSTGDSIFMVNTFITEEAPDLEDFANYLSTNIAKEMPFGEMKTDSMTAIQKADEPIWFQERVSVTLIYTIPHIREYRSIKNTKRESFLTSHTSVEYQAKVDPDFSLLLNHLLSRIKRLKTSFPK